MFQPGFPAGVQLIQWFLIRGARRCFATGNVSACVSVRGSPVAEWGAQDSALPRANRRTSWVFPRPAAMSAHQRDSTVSRAGSEGRWRPCVLNAASFLRVGRCFRQRHPTENGCLSPSAHAAHAQRDCGAAPGPWPSAECRVGSSKLWRAEGLGFADGRSSSIRCTLLAGHVFGTSRTVPERLSTRFDHGLLMSPD